MTPARLAASALLAVVALAWPARATTCDAIAAANPDGGTVAPVLYIEGADAVAPFLAPLQRALSVDRDPITVVYIGDGGCVGAANLFTSTPISKSPAAVYYAGEMAETCTLPLTGGPGGGSPVADVAVSDVYAPSCGTLPGGALPSGVGDFLGPVEPMMFVVPAASTQRAISVSAAYFVFGFGSGSGVAPWTSNASMYRRNASSAVQALLSVAIGVPLSQWAGVDASSLPASLDAGVWGASAVLNALEADPNPERAIGILAGSDVPAGPAPGVDVLAYKDNQESCAYYPDSTPTARDKANVRDGHYTLWGPLHFFTYVDGSGAPTNPLVGRLLSYLLGTAVPPGGVDYVAAASQSNLIPPCAMRVTRTGEMGPLASYAPQASCSCYYDYVSTGATSCQSCTQQADCPTSAPVCNLSYPAGFCEPE